MADDLLYGGFRGPGGYMPAPGNVASWPLDVVGYFGVDPVNGDDSRAGVIYAPPGANLGTTLRDVAWRTLEKFYNTFPQVGAGRMAVLLMGANAGGALLPWSAADVNGRIDLSGVSGYRYLVARGTQDFTNSADDKILLGFIPGVNGPNVDLSFEIQGIAGNVVTVVAGALPAMPLATTFRAHKVGANTFATITACNPGAFQITFDDASAFAPGDDFWLERPGVTIAQYRECIDRAQLRSAAPQTQSTFNFLAPAGGLVGVQFAAHMFVVGPSLLGCADGSSASTYCGIRDDLTNNIANRTMLTNWRAGSIALTWYWTDEARAVRQPNAPTVFQSLNFQFNPPFGQGIAGNPLDAPLPSIESLYGDKVVQIYDGVVDSSNPPPFFAVSRSVLTIKNSFVMVGLLSGAPDSMQLEDSQYTQLVLHAGGQCTLDGAPFLPTYQTSFGLLLLGTNTANQAAPEQTSGLSTHYALRDVTGLADAGVGSGLPLAAGRGISIFGAGFTVEIETATVSLTGVNGDLIVSSDYGAFAPGDSVRFNHADLLHSGFTTPNQVRIVAKGRPCPQSLLAHGNTALLRSGDVVMIGEILPGFPGPDSIQPALADTLAHASSVVGVALTTPVNIQDPVLYANGPFHWLRGVAPGVIAAGSPIYLSAAVPGQFTLVPPAVVLPLGVLITNPDANGEALVAWRADVLPDAALALHTLAATYTNGAAAADQTMIILDADGGAVNINGTTPGLMTPTVFEINVIGGSMNFYTRGGFDVASSITIAVPAAISTWNVNAFLSSTLTLTAGGVAPTSLSCTIFEAPVITQTAGAAYTVPVAATVTIAGPPAAGAGGGATPTLTASCSLLVRSGTVALGSVFAPYAGTLMTLGGSAGYTAIQIGESSTSNLFFGWNSAASDYAFVSTYAGSAPLVLQGGGNNVLIGTFTDDAASVLRVLATKSVASAAGAVWDGIKFAADTLTITGGPGAITSLCKFLVEGPTVTSAAANVTTDFYTQRIGVATFVGVGPASATRNWSLYVEGNTRFGGAQTIPGKQILVGASPYTVLETDYFLEVQSNGGAITINLPALTGGTQLNGRIIIIKDSGYNAGVANITIARGNAGDKIDNVADSYTIAVSTGLCLWLKANTANNDWEII